MLGTVRLGALIPSISSPTAPSTSEVTLIQSNAMARMKIGIQLPVAPFNTLPRGTSRDAVPFAV